MMPPSAQAVVVSGHGGQVLENAVRRAVHGASDRNVGRFLILLSLA